MNKEEKDALVDGLSETLKAYQHFYVVDIEGLNADKTSKLRRKCFGSDIKLSVAKNTLLKRALATLGADFSEIEPAFAGNSALMCCNVGNAPAKLIKEFGEANGKPVLKAAWVEETCYLGADNLDALVAIKSKSELIADVVALLQSPAKNVVSALQGAAGNKIHGLLETLGSRE